MSQAIERTRIPPHDERAPVLEDHVAWAHGAAIAGAFSLLAWAAIAMLVSRLVG
jgi:hypothetical protein